MEIMEVLGSSGPLGTTTHVLVENMGSRNSQTGGPVSGLTLLTV